MSADEAINCPLRPLAGCLRGKMESVRAGKEIHLKTLIRWATIGAPDGHGGKIVLRAVKRSCWLTKDSWVDEFCAAMEGADPPPPQTTRRTPTKRARGDARADATCKAARL